ncbi:MAG: hypothetical protein KBT87_14690 [Gammaproteobacteria bacterium]|nr:hypothetical protein [Gammaproteobacteria bacterium]
MHRLLFLMVMISSFALASDEKIIPSAAPQGMDALTVNLKGHEGTQEYKGGHGLKEYCYSNNGFITYSYNLLGKGYILSTTNDENRICNSTNKKPIAKNAIGISLKMQKNEIEKILGINITNDHQVVIWQTKTEIKGVPYDLQTYATFKFIKGQLVYLSVFTTETS